MIRIVNKDLVLLVTIAFVRARWHEAPPSELRYRPNCNLSPRELQKIFFCTYGLHKLHRRQNRKVIDAMCYS